MALLLLELVSIAIVKNYVITDDVFSERSNNGELDANVDFRKAGAIIRNQWLGEDIKSAIGCCLKVV